MNLHVLVRLVEIQRVLLRHGLDDYVRATHLYRPLRFLFFLSPGVWFERRRQATKPGFEFADQGTDLWDRAHALQRLPEAWG